MRSREPPNPSLGRWISTAVRISWFAMTSTSPSPLAHLEPHTHDRAGASSLYQELLGWRSELVEAAGREYLALDLGSGLGGGNPP
jgi:hypothetical protein